MDQEEQCRPLIVWFITDNKPGHLNQLKGLESRLSVHAQIQSKWLSASESAVTWLDILFRRLPDIDLNTLRPDIVIGAGHRTHKHVLAMKRHFGCFSVLLMKPSLPVWWFDAVIIPEHDNPAVSDRVLVTTGVLNNVVPQKRSAESVNPVGKGLILIGGESKHYEWDNESVLQQLEQVVMGSKGVNEWVLSNSRRTPDTFLSLLKEKKLSSVRLVEHQDTDRQWLPDQMAVCDRIWVTPDSVSMVYESITSGASTSLFKLTYGKPSRVVKGIDCLISNGLAIEWPELSKSSNSICLWEADRAANWLLCQYGYI